MGVGHDCRDLTRRFVNARRAIVTCVCVVCVCVCVCVCVLIVKRRLLMSVVDCGMLLATIIKTKSCHIPSCLLE
jgi:hypothetical protein